MEWLWEKRGHYPRFDLKLNSFSITGFLPV
jgi:hypothetical protein